MERPFFSKAIAVAMVLCALMFTTQGRAQTPTGDDIIEWEANDTIDAESADDRILIDTLHFEGDEGMLLVADTANQKRKRDWSTWRPEAKRAMWLAIVLPGGGQIYNRKYWKLPIVYGGFVGCAYAMRWNNMMYHDYSQAYLDLMDDDPLTQSYNQFMHLGASITSDNIERYQTLFKKRKDRFRRWRDLSFFVMVGVYAISIIDAYVDASLSEFDISTDLSMSISPTIINGNTMERNRWKSSAIGLQCSLNF